MITINVHNSLCSLKNVTPSVLSALRKTCIYFVTTGRKLPIKQKDGTTKWIKERHKNHLMDRKGVFPTGLLYRVISYLKLKTIEYSIVDTRTRPALNKDGLKTLFVKRQYTPYPEQVEAAKTALRESRGIISAPTGTGKSAICALICDEFKVPTLVVVPSLELKRQLTETLREAFGRGTVGPLGKSCEPEYFISVENVDALSSKRKLKGIDCVIIDEFHHSAAVTYRELNLKSWSDVYFKIGLTATPFRSNDEERLLLESVLSQLIYKISYETAVKNKYIVPMEAYYIDLPKENRVKDFVNYHAAYSHFVVNNEARNEIIANIASNLAESKIPTIILTKHIAHGVVLQEKIEGRGHTAPFAEGKNELKSDYIKSFNDLECPTLIGTIGVLGEGVDSKPAEYIVLAGGGKSKNQFFQNIGRGFRVFPGKESCKVIMIRDPNNKWMLKHFNACVKYLEEEFGVTPVKLDL